eukprot:TRINITY_DN16791_c0_g1_i1.p2 TRINITY_DN16791_c0_g1~~TRINITY_DN16791_c0_g1_i1.p2  ORF type:complete len:94 (-),score=10.40 TRINITY_DN16791_c0_g1_i1:562-843(-)
MHPDVEWVQRYVHRDLAEVLSKEIYAYGDCELLLSAKVRRHHFCYEYSNKRALNIINVALQDSKSKKLLYPPNFRAEFPTDAFLGLLRTRLCM